MNQIVPTTRSPPQVSLYARLLGTAWTQLAVEVREAHLDGERLCCSGVFRIQHGTSWLSRIVAAILRLPRAGDAVATQLTVLRTRDGEKWVRRFAKNTMTTTQAADASGLLIEHFGMFEMRVRLEVVAGTLIYTQVGAALRLGMLRVPLCRRLWPHVTASEEANGKNGTHVSVRVTLPLAGLLISYDGCLDTLDTEEAK
jgi:hypothetical protein